MTFLVVQTEALFDNTGVAGHPIHIALVAGETSGDKLGAGLIKELKRIYPDAKFSGVGGALMAAEGCDIMFDMERIGVMGFDGLASKLFDILKIRKTLLTTYTQKPPSVFIGIDVPDFNLTLEKGLKEHGVKTVHYVSPTVWAWRGYRIHKIRKSIDHMLALFPFEERYYQKQSIPVTCVGHSMADEIDQPNRTAARQRLGLGDGLIISILPGSRRSEVKRLAALFVESVQILSENNPGVQFVLPFASQKVRDEFDKQVGDISHLPIQTFDGQARSLMEASDMVILASGTAALEAALMRRAHIVVYKLPVISYLFLQRLRHVDHYSMTNHLLPSPMVPELMQENATPENVVKAVNTYLANPEQVVELEGLFESIHQNLKRDANLQAASVVESLIGEVA